MITRYQEGRFVVVGDRWKTAGGWISRIFRRDDIGRPNEEALRAAAHVKNLIASTSPNVQVQPLIIFVDPRVQLDITDPTVPVLYADSKREPNLRDYLRDYARQQSPQEVIPVKKKAGRSSKAVVPAEDGAGIIAPEEIAEALETSFPQKP
jgi:hypothetical protein